VFQIVKMEYIYRMILLTTKIYNNTITNSKIGLGIEEVGSGNKIYSNTIIDTIEKPVNIEDSDLEEESIMKDNKIINARLQH
jgi:hypothetical protein